MKRHYTTIMLGGTSRIARIARIARTAMLTLLLGASTLTLAVPAPALAGGTIPNLGAAGSFGVLGGSAVTNTGPTTVRGDLGVSPGTAVSGFPPGIVIGTIHAGDAVAAQAQNDANTAYNNAAGQACDVNLTGQDLGGMTLTPGVYCFSSSAQLTGQLTLDGQGNPDSVFIFQVGSTLTTASNASVLVINGAQPCRIFWQIGSSATLGTNTHFQGNILALTSITLNTGAMTSTGLYALNGAVTLDTNDIQSCAGPVPTATATSTATSVPSATSTATSVPSATNTSTATETTTLTAIPATNTSIPVATNTPVPASTNTAIPTIPAATNTPVNSATATNTSIPIPPTATNVPINTATSAPTNTPRPSATNTPSNTAVPVNTVQLTNTAIATSAATNTPPATATANGATQTAITSPTDTVSLSSPTATVTLTTTLLPTQTPGGPSATPIAPIPGDTPTETPTVAPKLTAVATGTVVPVAVPSPTLLLPPTGGRGGLPWLGLLVVLFSVLLLAASLGMQRLYGIRVRERGRGDK